MILLIEPVYYSLNPWGSSITMPSNTKTMVVHGNSNVPGVGKIIKFMWINSIIHAIRSLLCTYCEDMYHRKATCYKLIGYPPGHPKSKEKAQHQSQDNDKNWSNSAFGNPFGKPSGCQPHLRNCMSLYQFNWGPIRSYN